jgi:hypothetical protein
MTKTKPSDIYTVECSPNISDDYTTYYNNVVDEDQWGEDGVVTQLLNISTKEHVGTKLNVQEHPNVKYYVDVFTNVNDSPKPNLSEDAHGLPIDLAEPTCGM